MNTKAMEAAEDITGTYMVLSHTTSDIGEVTKEVAAIISKHFPEQGVPSKCPVCSGRCTVAQNFYNPDMTSTADIARKQCRTCEGKGIIYRVPGRLEPSVPMSELEELRKRWFDLWNDNQIKLGLDRPTLSYCNDGLVGLIAKAKEQA